jgi:hypothetical protein
MTVAGPTWSDVTLQIDAEIVSNCPSCGDIQRLVFRYLDPDNNCAVYFSRYYGVVGVEQWTGGRRMFAEVPLSPNVGQWYTLGAVVMGAGVEVHLDGVLMLGWTLPDGTTRGRIGLSTDRDQAYFDNVIVHSCAP